MILEEKLSNIPKSCGCYLFKNDKGQVIYVGKSKYLPNRVKSYFRENHEEDKVRVLREKIRDVEFVTTVNEEEAILLEDDLIKLYHPKFNSKGKDNRTKRWYIGLTKDEFPKLEIYPKKIDEGVEVLCEFRNSNVCYEIFELIHNVINFRTCSYNINKKNIELNKFRPCLDYHIGKCDAPCSNLINKFQYRENCQLVRDLFSFKYENVESKLKKVMYHFSKKMEYEKCNKIKIRLEWLQTLKEKLEPLRIQNVFEIAKKTKEVLSLKNTPLVIEAFDNSHHSGDCQVSCSVRFVNGLPEKTSYRTFNIKSINTPDDYASFEEVLNRRFKRLVKERGNLPSLIVIDGGRGQLNVGVRVLTELNLIEKIDIISISKNDRHKSETIHLTDGKEIKMGHDEKFFYLARIQDEVHRFTIGFHRKKKNNKILK